MKIYIDEQQIEQVT